MMKCNHSMEHLYQEVKENHLDNPQQLTKRLLDIINHGYIVTKGCVLLRAQEKMARTVKLEDFPDRTGYECFVNHIHIEDYLDEQFPSTQLTIVGQGLAFTVKLREKLLSSPITSRVKFIVSSDDVGCSVRFHLIRKGEEWVSPDLNSYKHEAILVLDT